MSTVPDTTPHPPPQPPTVPPGPLGGLREQLLEAGEQSAGQLVAVLQRDQLERWGRGECVPAEAYLDHLAQLRPGARPPGADEEEALDLIWGEFLLRRRRGEAPALDEFQGRFPAYGQKLRLMCELEEHLGLEDTPHRAEAPAAPPGWPDVPGYEVLGELGRGGMGVVYRARHEGLGRVVALKMVRAGEDAGAASLARFQTEARAVARLGHPNVVQIYEVGGSPAGPFMALELVEGGSLAQKLNGRPLPAGRSAEVVETVARAVHFAHQRGILHRDLKPGNVLLTPDGVPKVTDFGLAKLLEDSAEGPTHTGAILGTPGYMAPEQATGRTGEVGVSADVYALGAVLYECLTGRPPFRGLTPLQTLEQVRTREAVRPSSLEPRVPGDLETICLKCLEKEPGRRYPTAEALAEELRRFRAGEPILARPVGGVARLARWARRRPAQAGLVAMGLLLLVGAMAGVSVFAWQAEKGRREEGRRLAQLERVVEILSSVFRDLDPVEEFEEGAPLRAQLGKRLDRAAELLEGEAVGDPLAVARLQRELGETQRHLGYPERAVVLHGKARQTFEAALGPDHPETLACTNDLAGACQEAGQIEQAVPLFEQVLKGRRAVLGPDNPDTVESLQNLALAYQDAGQLDRALPLHEEALEKRRALREPDDTNLLIEINNLASAYYQAGRLDRAVVLFEEVFHKRQGKVSPDHPHMLSTVNNLGRAYLDTGQLDRALPLLEENLERKKVKLGPDHPDTLLTLNNVAVAYRAAGRPDRAVPLCEDAFQKCKARLGADHPHTLLSMSNLALALQETRGHARALQLWREILAVRSRTLPADHPDGAAARAGLARCLLQMGRPAEAEPLLRESLAVRQKQQPEGWATFHTESLLGGSLLGQRKYAEAEPLLAEGYRGLHERRSQVPFPSRDFLSEARQRLVELYGAWGRKAPS
jgi:tetratricopeptide (TPR) repeat protein